jgi:hypothetical protein
MADMISQKLGDIYKTTSISQKPTGPITCWNEGKIHTNGDLIFTSALLKRMRARYITYRTDIDN